ncbi:MAG TPA: carboxypeptidase-like regulatory domain-containing protein [Candidatus Aminicenantes bacterium]|nr:carboxypeptidase-like regulatory domain-containing protein [Candidatus Aminicenantes bacterium]
MVAAWLVLTVPLPAAAQGQEKSYARQGTLQGTVFSEGQRARVANAVVKIRNLNNQREYASQPTDAKGNYRILMIEEGWYTLGVSTPAGDFNLNYGVYIKAGETAKLSVEMLPGGMLEGKGGNGGAGKKGFFATPGGVLVIVALAGGAAFGVYELTREKEASPVR